VHILLESVFLVPAFLFVYYFVFALFINFVALFVLENHLFVDIDSRDFIPVESLVNFRRPVSPLLVFVLDLLAESHHFPAFGARLAVAAGSGDCGVSLPVLTDDSQARLRSFLSNVVDVFVGTVVSFDVVQQAPQIGEFPHETQF